MTAAASRAVSSRVSAVSAAVLVAVAILSAAFGWALHLLPEGSWWLLLVAAVAVGPVVLAIRRVGAAGCLAALIGLTVLGFYRQSVSIGPVNLRPTDIPYVLLVVMIWVRPRRPRQEVRRTVGQLQIGLLVAVFGLSLFPVIANGDSGGLASLVSWLRFAQTMSLIWLVPYALTDETVRRRAPAIIAVPISIELAWAIGNVLLHGGIGSRLAGHNGPDTEGLLAAVLVAAVVIGRFPSHRALRWGLVALGLVALGMTRSVGATIAFAIVFGLARPLLGADIWRRRRASLGRPAQLLGLVLAAFFLIALVRPTSLPGSAGFDSSSTIVRVIRGVAGIEIFVHHPVIGVGWQRSSDPAIIGSPAITNQLHHLFPSASPDSFPTPEGSTTVHDAYIQILAESGLLGGVAAAAAFVAVIACLRRARYTSLPDSRDQAVIACATAMALLIAIWWNDNPLFGAQPETVLAAFSIGLLACRWPSAADSQPTALLSGSSAAEAKV